VTPAICSATALVLCLVMAGCDLGPASSGRGTVRLIARTSGEAPDLDVDGYEVTGFGPSPVLLRVNDTVILANIPARPYALDLVGLQSNCTARNGSTLNVTVASDATIDASWSLVCGLLPSSLDLTFATTTPSGSGAISVAIDAGVPFRLQARMTQTLDSLPPGVHTIAILDSTPNCQVSASVRQQITLVRQVRSHLDIPGTCSGGRLLFTSSGGLWMMNADTSDLHEIPLPQGVHTQWAALSPNGVWIAFASSSWELYVMRSDGTAAQRIAAAPTNPKELVWSPDGTQIALSGGTAPLYDYEIFVINSDGSGLRNLTADPNRDENPTWSPDGQHIAFTSDRARDSTLWTEQVFKMNADGSGIVPLSGPNGYYPDWAPDGSAIVFSNNGAIHTMAPDGTGEQDLPGVEVSLDQPKWSPDSRMLVAVARDGSHIHFINREGGSVIVATSLSFIQGLSWGP
jgi:Tol biopolymer transport system component